MVGVYLRRDINGKTPARVETASRRDDFDSPSLATRRSQMKLAKRPKGPEVARAGKKILPLESSTRCNIALSASSDIDSVKPRLRTITLASHKATSKSPPPLRSTRADIPPSPMTPRPMTRFTADDVKLGLQQQAEDTSLGESSTVTLQVARPPRSMKRSPSPLRMGKLPASEMTALLPANEQQPDERTSFDYDGIEWEMLNNGKQRQGGTTWTPSRPSMPRDNSSDKWSSIEKWRDYARATVDDAFVGPEARVLEEEHHDETVHNADAHAGSPSLPTGQSSGSLFPGEVFQSMSSMAPSVFFAAISEAPTTPTTRRMPRPMTSPVSPKTTSFGDLAQGTQQSFPDVHTRQFHRPSTAMRQETSDSFASGRLDRPTCPPDRERRHVPPHMFSPPTVGKGRQISPGNESVVSEASEVFQSADEGECSLSPSPHLLKSPRNHLHRRYHNAQKRASRIFGRTDSVPIDDRMDDGVASRRQPALHLTTAQLMALSEEAESGMLDTAQWQKQHVQLLTTDEDASPGDDPTSDSLPTPELSRLSATSRDEDSPNTPKSPLWQVEGNDAVLEQQSQRSGEARSYFEAGVFAAQQREQLMKTSPGTQLASPQPPRLIRRKSRRLSAVKGGMEDISPKPSMTFIKLESLPIQLVEAPTPSSWRSALTTAEYEEFSSTFGSKEMHRQEVIEELSVTEWNFVISMSSILRVFSLPLRKSDLSFQDNVPLEVARLFNWLDDILAFHVKLLKSLDKVRNRHPSALVVCVAGAITKHIEGLSIHQSYLVNFERVTTLLDVIRRSNNKGDLASFDEIVERQSRLPECRGMALSSFLLKPVQRLMKYPLFFKVSASLSVHFNDVLMCLSYLTLSAIG